MTQHDPNNAPYARDRHVDKPGIVGARWWHAALADQAAQESRRSAIRNILIAGGVIAGFGAMLAMCIKGAASSGGGLSDEQNESRKTALEMQKAYGWSFGAIGEALVFDGVTTKPFAPGALSSLATDLSPSQSELRPYFQTTLFDSPDAVPTSIGALPAEEREGFKPLSTAVLPILTPAMDAAYARGKSLASLFASLSEAGGSAGPANANAAIVVDLPGPEAVAFAAGAAGVLDPVFLFDNWPHPRGVVRAQETLSAAAYYQPAFEASKATPLVKGKKPPMFVLDRRRLNAYADDATQFDNRYVAKLPSPASTMKSLGVQHVLYVVPTRADTSRELDDLNDDFVSYTAAGIDVKALSLDLFGPDNVSNVDAGSFDPGGVYYGSSKTSHHAFFVDYPWARPARNASARPPNPGPSFKPVARSSTFSSGSPTSSSSTRTRPTNFGTVPVVIAVGTGVILGARYSRSGSWNRSSGGFGG